MKKKIVIGIDLNDVVRDYIKQYIIYFDKAQIDKSFNPDKKLKFAEGDMYSPFKFPTKKDKEDFETDNYVFELLASAKPSHKSLPGVFNIWLNDLNDEYENNVEVWFISPGEYHLQRQATLFFLSKICSRVEHIWFPKTVKETWNQFDVLVTANPLLLKDTPRGKASIKINTDYNKKSDSTYTFSTFMNLISEENKDFTHTLLNRLTT